MARAATTPEKTRFATFPQASQLYLAVQPIVEIFSARLNGVPTSTDMVLEINYDAGVGSYTNVLTDMTMLVGSTAGGYEYGFVRIRKAPTSSKFYIAETSEIKWVNDAYLTVLDDFDIWPRHIKIDGLTFWMDGDIVYSNQHEVMDPIPVIGSHFVGWLVDGEAVVALDASDTYVIDSTITGHAWACATGTIDTPTTATANLTLTTTGMHRISYTATAANGASFTAYRYAFVYDEVDQPLTEFSLLDCAANRDSGGWTFRIGANITPALNGLRDRALCILFSKDYYGANQVEIGHQAGRENIWAIGRVVEGSISNAAGNAGTVEFMVANAAHFMGQTTGFTMGVELAKLEPTRWTDMPLLTVDKALYHLLRWRSTVTRVIDVILPGDERLASELSAPQQTLWQQVYILAWTSLMAVSGVDRFDRLHISLPAYMIPEANRGSIPTIRSLVKGDWSDSLGVSIRQIPSVGQLDVSGVAVDASGAGAPYFSLAPGKVFKTHGNVETIDKLLLTGQLDVNTKAGLLLGWRNNKMPMIDINLSAMDRLGDLWPAQYYDLTMAADDNPIGWEYSGPVLPVEISLSASSNGACNVRLSVEPETLQDVSITVIHEIPPGPKPPPTPPPPGTEPPGPPVVPPEGPHQVVIATETHGLLYTENFHEHADAKWFFFNRNLTDTQKVSVLRMKKTPGGIIAIGLTDDLGGPGAAQMRYLMITDALGGWWVDLLDYTTVDQGSIEEERSIVAFGINEDASDEILAIGGGHSSPSTGTKKVYIGSSAGMAQADSSSLDLKSGAGDASYGLNKWMCIADFEQTVNPPEYVLMAAGGTVEIADGNYITTGGSYTFPVWHHRAASKIFVLNGGGAKLRVISDNDPTVEVLYDVLNGAYGEACSMAVSPSGMALMMAWTGQIAKKSADGGATWTSLTPVDGFGVGFDHFINCGDDSCWIAWTVQKILYTKDFGASWVDHTGDLAAVAPLCDIQHAIVYGYEDPRE